LEFAEGFIWANIWYDDHILKIDPASGKVLGKLDLSSIKQTLPLNNTEQVLNGIAWDEKQNAFWITGKNWPKMFLIKIKH
jgi:glutaminyl-peptide cyclotransferase